MNASIKIPNPCNESWSEMVPKQNGRHCGACEKVVVDFTDWETEAILQYLKSNSKTCGRLRVDQLEKSEVVVEQNNWLPFIIELSLSKLARLAIFTFTVFQLVACNSENSGKVRPASQIDSTINKPDTTVRVDSGMLLGEPAVVEAPIQRIECSSEIMGIVIQPPTHEYIKGGIFVEPVPAIDSSKLIKTVDSVMAIPKVDTLGPTDITK